MLFFALTSLTRARSLWCYGWLIVIPSRLAESCLLLVQFLGFLSSNSPCTRSLTMDQLADFDRVPDQQVKSFMFLCMTGRKGGVVLLPLSTIQVCFYQHSVNWDDQL
ncbi:hypothetical protein ACMFMG_009394 [Clarireedia jacksonii]